MRFGTISVLVIATLVAGCGGSSDGAPAPTVSLAVEPDAIGPGQTTTLTWTSNNATSCMASGGWSGNKTLSGTERTEALLEATEFELTCSGAGGQASSNATVSIDADANFRPQVDKLELSAETVDLGQAVTFDWVVSDRDGDILRCVLDVTGFGPEIVFEDCGVEGSFEYTHESAGFFSPKLVVSDGAKSDDRRRSLWVRSDFWVSVSQPQDETIVGPAPRVVATVQSPLEVTSVLARVADRETELVYSVLEDYFEGNVSMEGLERGEQVIVVVAQDVTGEQSWSVSPVLFDQRPELTVTSPQNDTLVTSTVRIATSCTDDDPVGCDIVVQTDPGGLEVTGSNSIDTELDLSAFDGRTVDIRFRATDSVHRSTFDLREVHVETSDVLSLAAAVDGTILDVQDNRLLVRKTVDDDELEIFDTTAMTTESVPLPEGWRVIHGDVFLTPYGTIFIAEGPGPGHNRRVYDWNQGLLEDLDEPVSDNVLAVAGDFAVWASRSDVSASIVRQIRRDLGSRSQVVVGEPVLGNNRAVAANGAVAYRNNDGQIAFFIDGATQILTNDVDLDNHDPFTDGARVVYKKANADSEYAIVLHDGVGEVVLRDFQQQQPSWYRDYRIVPGWVAYTDIGNLAQTHLWMYDGAGERRQLTFFGESVEIEVLAENGEVMLLNAGRRYLVRPDGTMTEVGSEQGVVHRVGNRWYVSIGGNLLEVLSDSD